MARLPRESYSRWHVRLLRKLHGRSPQIRNPMADDTTALPQRRTDKFESINIGFAVLVIPIPYPPNEHEL